MGDLRFKPRSPGWSRLVVILVLFPSLWLLSFPFFPSNSQTLVLRFFSGCSVLPRLSRGEWRPKDQVAHMDRLREDFPVATSGLHVAATTPLADSADQDPEVLEAVLTALDLF